MDSNSEKSSSKTQCEESDYVTRTKRDRLGLVLRTATPEVIAPLARMPKNSGH